MCGEKIVILKKTYLFSNPQGQLSHRLIKSKTLKLINCSLQSRVREYKGIQTDRKGKHIASSYVHFFLSEIPTRPFEGHTFAYKNGGGFYLSIFSSLL